MNRQARLDELYKAADAAIGSLPGVHPTEKLSFRVATRVFVRIDLEEEIRLYGFKLSHDDAHAACSKYQNVVPMKFGGMGDKGWVSFRLTRKDQLSALKTLTALSHAQLTSR